LVETGEFLRKLTIVFHDAGGGHRSAATALRDSFAEHHSHWEVTLLNLQDLLDSLDIVHKATGLRIQDAYNLILRKGWTRFTPQLLVLLQGVIRLFHPQVVKTLKTYWSQHPADMVLSVIPHFNRALAESLRGTPAAAPFVTLLTDLADYPPRFWIEPQSEFIVVGTERAKQQALEMGHPAHRIFETSGMILKPKFYQKTEEDRASERKRLGLEPNCPTGIVLFGGHGSRAMLEITRRLDQSNNEVQLILLCGHNRKLAVQLRGLRTKKPILVQEFTPNVEYYMSLADFFIGKPGPGSISEALQFHLPVIVERNSKTLPQERYNAEWVTEKGLGIVVSNFREIAPAVQHLLSRSTFDKFRFNVSTYSNRALFEVPIILEKCYERSLASRFGQSGALLASKAAVSDSIVMAETD
jgi:Glycosyltransferase family 28 C-terminal domain/Monogalactosyldiacylglycerol (MGDG) synthase